MSDVIPINLAVEDALSESVLRQMLRQSGRPFAPGTCFGHVGFGYLKNKIAGFNNAAKGVPFLVLADLDRVECAPSLINDWLSVPRHHNLLFRIAGRSVESWLLAHRSACAKFLGISEKNIPAKPDELNQPKDVLIQLAAQSPRKTLREAIVPQQGSTARIGPDYNGRLSAFIHENWKVKEAVKHSPSLLRAFEAITSFKPVFHKQ